MIRLALMFLPEVYQTVYGFIDVSRPKCTKSKMTMVSPQARLRNTFITADLAKLTRCVWVDILFSPGCARKVYGISYRILHGSAYR